jgi:hypothetical protein
LHSILVPIVEDVSRQLDLHLLMRRHVREMFGDFLGFELPVPAKELTARDPVASRDVGQLILKGQVVLDRPEVLPFLEHYQLQLSRVGVCQLHLSAQ